MAMSSLDTLLNVLGTGFNIYSLRRSLRQQSDLHEEEMATSTEQHYSSLSAELLAIAKEADRDVWEQRNNQFNNLLVCAVLMFGVAVGNINEGTYKYDKLVDTQGLLLTSLVSKDGMFAMLSGVSMGSFFLCIVSCLIVMRRMSSYMIVRGPASARGTPARRRSGARALRPLCTRRRAPSLCARAAPAA